MKRKISAILLIVVATLMVALPADAKKKRAAITFDESSYEFGTVSETGGKVSHDFVFTNTGDANLVISDAKADCGCTVPEYPKNPIAPGKKGVIRVTYNPLYRPGGFHKQVTVKTNAKPNKSVIKISGVVKGSNKK